MFHRVKGTRDFYPPERKILTNMFGKFLRLSHRYGYEEVSTPVFEEVKTLTAKSGEDVKEQIYLFEKKGSEEIGLRFDMTIPCARLFLKKEKEIVKPVKWSYASANWRYENPQKGRLREFYQMGVEVLGHNKIEGEAEPLLIALDFLEELGLNSRDVRVRINNRRILAGIIKSLGVKRAEEVIRLIDKRRKIGEEVFAKELQRLGVKRAEELISILEIKDIESIKNNSLVGKDAAEGVEELESFMGAVIAAGKEEYMELDLTIARGFDYYTGNVYECFDTDEQFRSIFGGGSYDNLISAMGGKETKAAGMAIGDVTLQELLAKKRLLKEIPLGADYFIIIVDEKLRSKAFETASKLRKRYSVDIDLSGRNLSKQLSFANKKGAKNALFIGTKEIEKGVVKIKNLKSGEEKEVKLDSLLLQEKEVMED